MAFSSAFDKILARADHAIKLSEKFTKNQTNNPTPSKNPTNNPKNIQDEQKSTISSDLLVETGNQRILIESHKKSSKKELKRSANFIGTVNSSISVEPVILEKKYDYENIIEKLDLNVSVDSDCGDISDINFIGNLRNIQMTPDLQIKLPWNIENLERIDVKIDDFETNSNPQNLKPNPPPPIKKLKNTRDLIKSKPLSRNWATSSQRWRKPKILVQQNLDDELGFIPPDLIFQSITLDHQKLDQQIKQKTSEKPSNHCSDQFSDLLPTEIWLKILNLLKTHDLHQISLVSKQFHALSTDFSLKLSVKNWTKISIHRSSQIKKVVFNKVMSPPEQVEVLERVSRCGNLKTAVFKNFTPWKVIYFKLIPVNLVKLDLAWSNVESLNGIEFLSKLEGLEVAGNINLDTTSFQSLAGLHRLSSLGLRGLHQLKNLKCIPETVKNKLTSLDISLCTGLHNFTDLFPGIPRNNENSNYCQFQGLKILKLGKLPNLRQIDLHNILKEHGSCLEELNLSDNGQLDGGFISEIVSYCGGHMKKLDVKFSGFKTGFVAADFEVLVKESFGSGFVFVH